MGSVLLGEYFTRICCIISRFDTLSGYTLEYAQYLAFCSTAHTLPVLAVFRPPVLLQYSVLAARNRCTRYILEYLNTRYLQYPDILEYLNTRYQQYPEILLWYRTPIYRQHRQQQKYRTSYERTVPHSSIMHRHSYLYNSSISSTWSTAVALLLLVV